MDTAAIFAAYPKTQLTIGPAIWDSIMATVYLIILVHAINDAQNQAGNSIAINSILVTFVVMTIILSYGYNAGALVNPARDLGPRFFTLVAGWGTDTFTMSGMGGIAHFWWVPLLGPMIGAVFATVLYDVCISNHWPTQ
jgi:glycerol uptake facilitator-like aquaporin